MRATPRTTELPVAQDVWDWTDALSRPQPMPRLPGRNRTTESTLQALGEAMAAGRASQVIAEVLDWQGRGERTDVLVRWLAGWIGQREGGLADATFRALADLTRAATDFEPQRAGLPLALAAVLASESLGGRRLLAGAQVSSIPAEFSMLHDAVAQRQAIGAEAIVARAVQDGVPPAEIERWLLRLACAFPGDAGVAARTALAFTDLRAAAGEAGLLELYPRLARALAERPERQAVTQAHADRMAPLQAKLADIAAAADPDKARFFQEAKFRPHLLDGKGDTAWRACVKALEFGVPRELLAGSLALAAAERVLRFDPRHDADDSVLEGWPDALQLLGLSATVRQLAALVPEPEWAALFLYAVAAIHAAAALDAPEKLRFVLPEPEALHQTWDHGPEIAKIVAHLQAGRAERAIAIVRAYFLMVLPDQPLCRQLLEASMADLQGPAWAQAQAIAGMSAAVAAFQALGAHPQRELPLCAATRVLANWRQARTSWRLAMGALDGRATGMQPRALVGPGL